MLKETESMTLVHVVALLVWSSENKELEAERRREINQLFETDDPELSRLVKDVREKAALVMLGYVVESSPFALAFAVAAVPVQLAAVAWRWLKVAFINGGSVSPQFRTQLAAALLGILAVLGITTRASAQATMEEKAFSIHSRA